MLEYTAETNASREFEENRSLDLQAGTITRIKSSPARLQWIRIDLNIQGPAFKADSLDNLGSDSKEDSRNTNHTGFDLTVLTLLASSRRLFVNHRVYLSSLQYQSR